MRILRGSPGGEFLRTRLYSIPPRRLAFCRRCRRCGGSDGQPSSASADKVVFTYNHDGTVATRTDQNQSVITYDYDSLRRKTRERVTTLGSSVNGAVLQVVTTYDSAGRVSKLTNRDSSTADSGNVVNEVQYSYNGYGQLSKDEQEHSGAVSGSTLNVQYAWTESTGNNHSRLDYMTYPNGRTLYTKYTSTETSTQQDDIDDAFSRVGQLTDSSGNVYAQYAFAGLSRMTKRESRSGTGWLGNDTALNLDSDNDGTSDVFKGLDQFGRVAKQKVTDNSDTTTRTNIEYQANRDSSPQFAEPQSSTVLGKSSAYTYDGLHRLSQADTGRLNSGRTAVTGEWATPQSIVYTMDILGNMSTLNRKNSGVDANETRTHNATNELTARTIAAESARYWVNDDFADNDVVMWGVADLDGDGTTSGGDDGTWSAASGKGQCDTVTTLTGAPGTGNDASVLLVDAGAIQDVLVSASVTLNTSADGGGIVFGYVDNANYWVLLIDSGGNYRLYQVSSGTFNLRKSGTTSVSPPGTFGVSCEVRSGAVENISGMTGGFTPASPIPAGEVGLWAGSGSATIQYDNFKVLDMGMPKEIDGKWYSTAADTTITSGTLQFGTVDCERLAVRRGFRGGKYVFECDQPVGSSNGNAAGVLLHYQDPENFMGVIRDCNSCACVNSMFKFLSEATGCPCGVGGNHDKCRDAREAARGEAVTRFAELGCFIPP